jgi:hypothetical protein
MKKKTKNLTRRDFLADAGKTLFFSSMVASAVPSFLSGCTKSSCNQLKETADGDHLCDDYYVCNNSLGFACPESGKFGCNSDIFSCYVDFSCPPASSFSCQPSSTFSNPKGGAGG